MGEVAGCPGAGVDVIDLQVMGAAAVGAAVAKHGEQLAFDGVGAGGALGGAGGVVGHGDGGAG